MHHKSTQITPGEKRQRWTILSRAADRGSTRKRPYWLCACECGTVKEVRQDRLLDGTAVSCGCYHREQVSSHRKSKAPEYKAWQMMIQRCTNPLAHAYALYGGRGISVCPEWIDDFEQFYRDMGPRPTPGHSLDRIDNDSDYTPENCRWATSLQQMNNRTVNHMLTFEGRTQSLSQWAAEYGLHYETLRHRLLRGYSIERALQTPVNRRQPWRSKAQTS